MCGFIAPHPRHNRDVSLRPGTWQLPQFHNQPLRPAAASRRKNNDRGVNNSLTARRKIEDRGAKNPSPLVRLQTMLPRRLQLALGNLARSGAPQPRPLFFGGILKSMMLLKASCCACLPGDSVSLFIADDRESSRALAASSQSHNHAATHGEDHIGMESRLMAHQTGAPNTPISRSKDARADAG